MKVVSKRLLLISRSLVAQIQNIFQHNGFLHANGWNNVTENMDHACLARQDYLWLISILTSHQGIRFRFGQDLLVIH